MRLTIPFLYEGDIAYSRNRRDDLSSYHHRNVHLGETEIEIPEISRSEAPVAVSAVLLERIGEIGFEARYHDGGFYYTNRLYPGGGRAALAASCARGEWRAEIAAHPVVAALNLSDRMFAGADGRHLYSQWFSGNDFAVPKATVKWDMTDRDREAAVEACSSLLVIDGEMWRRMDEPKIVAAHDTDSAGYVRTTVRLCANGFLGVSKFSAFHNLNVNALAPEMERVFAALDLDDARAVALAFDPRVMPSVRFRQLEVHMPEVLAFDAGLSHVARAASRFLQQTSNGLSGGTDAQIASWTSLRSSLLAAQAGRYDSDTLAGDIHRVAGSTKFDDGRASRAAFASLAAYEDFPVALMTGRVLAP